MHRNARKCIEKHRKAWKGEISSDNALIMLNECTECAMSACLYIVCIFYIVFYIVFASIKINSR